MIEHHCFKIATWGYFRRYEYFIKKDIRFTIQMQIIRVKIVTSWAAFSHARNHRWGTCLCVNRWSDSPKITIIQFPVSENNITDTKIMFLGQLEDNLWSKMKIWQPCNTKCGSPVCMTVSKLLPFDFPCPKT